jgi:hypothetical protein
MIRTTSGDESSAEGMICARRREMEWIAVADRLPEKREKPYQVLALCVKRHKQGTCYPGEPMRGVYQDWVLRNWPQNYTHWTPIPPLPHAC